MPWRRSDPRRAGRLRIPTRTSYLAAAAEGEAAKHISLAHLAAHPTIDRKPHGAFTDALLRVLEGQAPADFDRDGRMSLNEVYRAVADFMASRTEPRRASSDLSRPRAAGGCSSLAHGAASASS